MRQLGMSRCQVFAFLSTACFQWVGEALEFEPQIPLYFQNWTGTGPVFVFHDIFISQLTDVSKSSKLLSVKLDQEFYTSIPAA